MDKIKFAHLADLHLGAYRNNILSELNFKAFVKSIDLVIENKVDFCLFAGDIFDVPLPNLETVEKVLEQFLRLKQESISVYVIGGSHDYTHMQKSFIDLFDKADVFVDLSKFEVLEDKKIKLKYTVDKKTNTLISGLLGRKNGLEKFIYKNELIISNEDYPLKIFMFHTTIADILPSKFKNIESKINTSFLPKGFDYYAGGHIHTPIIAKTKENKIISYSGVLFPNNFREICDEICGFNICLFDKKTKKLDIKRLEFEVYKKVHIKIDLENLETFDAKKIIIKKLEESSIENKIVLLEIFGKLNGKIVDLELNNIVRNFLEKDPKIILKNTQKLFSMDIEEKFIQEDLDKNHLEKELLNEVFKNNRFEKIAGKLINLNLEKNEDERVIDFENRVIDKFDKILKEENS